MLHAGKPKSHRAYTQLQPEGICSHICGAYISLQPSIVSYLIATFYRSGYTGYIEHITLDIRYFWPASNTTLATFEHNYGKSCSQQVSATLTKICSWIQ
ncbi:hypothetical protein COCSUDRAFT_34625 [Coccomyxa subellipsoidea C-169]|uniref:Uncharacterized protein n=1 Tax=Coccomyxa subellipsoidea (strain C-169) TaxID=574566 RepID=I0YI51_COCSC|nr:hypothetical protein COCSUDRAFT_34625 [Coccomyxa subellipsoidea C-169]EIE18070.1 hypothetical protein COCSUDRAFT_34625 [Coccomyxa subellipsoidea C-169]|eukprot:XP_005642614.1 hypothetical protein COCSUDRAFT_34625 [Coccomyxa subellipsoidea C-169]